MATSDFASKFAGALAVAPARYDLLAVKPTATYATTFYNSALYAKSWLDPSPKDTDNIFRIMIEAVLSNTLPLDNAISDASAKLSLLFLN